MKRSVTCIVGVLWLCACGGDPGDAMPVPAEPPAAAEPSAQPAEEAAPVASVPPAEEAVAVTPPAQAGASDTAEQGPASELLPAPERSSIPVACIVESFRADGTLALRRWLSAQPLRIHRDHARTADHYVWRLTRMEELDAVQEEAFDEQGQRSRWSTYEYVAGRHSVRQKWRYGTSVYEDAEELHFERGRPAHFISGITSLGPRSQLTFRYAPRGQLEAADALWFGKPQDSRVLVYSERGLVERIDVVNPWGVRGSRIVYTYHPNGALASLAVDPQAFPDPQSVTFDPEGRVLWTNAAESFFAQGYTYDARGRLVQEREDDTLRDTNTLTVTYAYGDGGRLEREERSGHEYTCFEGRCTERTGLRVRRYTYTPAGLLSAVYEDANQDGIAEGERHVRYDARGRVQAETFSGSLVDTVTLRTYAGNCEPPSSLPRLPTHHGF